MAWKLNRVRQCKDCPWKVSANPHDIPDEYSVEKHQALKATIADGSGSPEEIMGNGPLRVMACHKSTKGHEAHCIGWLHNQIGTGNNIALRLQMLTCENGADIEIDGPQHATFADTLPKAHVDSDADE